MKNNTYWNQRFISTGQDFIMKYSAFFNSRKPKKIIKSVKQLVRLFRKDGTDLFIQLVGTILVWRYTMMAKLPQKESAKIEQIILRSFNHILNKTTYKNLEELKYLRTEATPKPSVFSTGNPLGILIDLKIIEFSIRFENCNDKNEKEKQWRSIYKDLNSRYRFRIPFLSAFANII